jgi:activator of the mannose operon (transcriptional antiterminator)
MNARRILILKYLNKERMASYREIAEALAMKERSVRYDVDAINDELSLRGLSGIEKLSKGMLMVPDDLDLCSLFEEAKDFVFSQEERETVIRLYVLFDLGSLNLRKLTDDFQVSRRSVQNDLNAVSGLLEKNGLNLQFRKKYELSGEAEDGFQARSRALMGVVPLLTKRGQLHESEAYILKTIREVFEPLSADDVIRFISRISDRTGAIFSDESFDKLIADTLAASWYLKKGLELPVKADEAESGFGQEALREFEGILGRKLTDKENAVLAGFTRYANRYVPFEVGSGLLSIDDLTNALMREMGRNLHLDFMQDGILRKGLLGHLQPMVERLRDNRFLEEDASGLIPEGYRYIYGALEEVIETMDMSGSLSGFEQYRHQIAENEKIYLAIYFAGSVRRIQRRSYKNILLVCGFGYGTTTMIRDELLNQYQVTIKESVPAYKIPGYTDWEDIDAVVSTVRMDLPVVKPFAQVNVLFDKDDHMKLSLAGLMRKNVLTDYLAIERRLDFLNDDDKRKVLHVIKEELGFRNMRESRTFDRLSDLLGKEAIRCVDEVPSWQAAVRMATGILEDGGKIDENYYKSVIEGIEARGFYSVTNRKFALLHGRESEGVFQSCMSLLITEKPVAFGDKQARLIFCLASRNKKEHVPGIIELVRMAEQTGFIGQLEHASTPGEAEEVIRRFEEK